MKLSTYQCDTSALPESIRNDKEMLAMFSHRVASGNSEEDGDYYVVPLLFQLDKANRLSGFQDAMQAFVSQLPSWDGNESKHVFLDESDFCKLPEILKDSIVFTTTPSKNFPKHRALPFYPHSHNDLDMVRLMAKPIGKSPFDLFFKGSSASIPMRQLMLDSIADYERNGLSAYVKVYTKYFWNRPISEDEKRKERVHYFERLTDAKFILCPRGTGTTSSRFFEAMYFGRIPVLISDEARLPLENLIDWEDWIVRVPEDDIKNLHIYVHRFVAEHDLSKVSEGLIERSRYYFERRHLSVLIQDTLRSDPIL